MKVLKMSNLVKLFLDNIQEGKRTTRSAHSRQRKIKQATSSMATTMAKKKNDPMYKRMIYFRDQYFKYRAMIHKKYSPRTRSKARR
jgi:hypothetical protein